MTDTEQKTLFKIAAELQCNITQIHDDINQIMIEIGHHWKKLTDFDTCFLRLNERISHLEALDRGQSDISIQLLKRIKSLEEHKSRQIDENRAVDRELEMLRENAGADKQ